MFLTESPFLPIARPICPLPTTKMSRPCFSSIMQSFAVAPLMFWNSDIRPSCSEVSLISVVPPSPLELLQLVLTERPQGDDRDPEWSPQHPRKLRGGRLEVNDRYLLPLCLASDPSSQARGDGLGPSYQPRASHPGSPRPCAQA